MEECALVERDRRHRVGRVERERVAEVLDEPVGDCLREVGEHERHQPVDRLDPRASLVRAREVDEEAEVLVPGALQQGLRDAIGRPGGPARGRLAPAAPRQPRQRAQALSVDRVHEHVLQVVRVPAKDGLEVVVRQLVAELREPRACEQGCWGDATQPDRVVVDRTEVEPALELRHDRDQPVVVGVTQRGEVAVVALEVGESLRQELVLARIDDPLHGLREHRRLDLRGRVRRAVERHAPGRAALEVVPLEPGDEVALPEDDVRDEPVRLLHGEEPAQLVCRALGVEARPDDRVEARVPEPLERVGAYARDREAVEPAVELAGLGVRLE